MSPAIGFAIGFTGAIAAAVYFHRSEHAFPWRRYYRCGVCGAGEHNTGDPCEGCGAIITSEKQIGREVWPLAPWRANRWEWKP